MEDLLFLLSKYGLEKVVLALVVNLLTSIVKIPIKRWAKKLKDSSRLTRFIVFLPAILGLGIVAVYLKFVKMNFAFDKPFISLWITTSSLSLTFYAVIEKLFFNGKKIVNVKEIIQSQEAIKEAEKIVKGVIEATGQNGEQVLASEKSTKIILKGKK